VLLPIQSMLVIIRHHLCIKVNNSADNGDDDDEVTHGFTKVPDSEPQVPKTGITITFDV